MKWIISLLIVSVHVLHDIGGDGTNNHRTLKTPERAENTAALLARTTGVLVLPRPMPVSQLRLPRWLGDGSASPEGWGLDSALPDPRGLGSASPDLRRLGSALPNGPRLARCPRIGFASPNNYTPLPHDARHRVGQDVRVNRGVKDRALRPYRRVPPGHDGTGAYTLPGVAEPE